MVRVGNLGFLTNKNNKINNIIYNKLKYNLLLDE